MAYNSVHLVLFTLLGFFLTRVAASPVSQLGETQVVLTAGPEKGGNGEHRYEHGELPPLQNTVGWVDPRLKGGRFLDVREVRNIHSGLRAQKIAFRMPRSSRRSVSVSR